MPAGANLVAQSQLDNGVVCDATPRPGVHADVVAAGDVARWSHPLYDDHLLRLEHWSNAVDHAAMLQYH